MKFFARQSEIVVTAIGHLGTDKPQGSMGGRSTTFYVDLQL